ncbi:S8 family peptidase [Parasphingorhabdus cellanae]|uniref:S8 family serine peptidase n=1 Tax=Parasphingorhabdus cellanae TaxID=2806553 RepID=A0ABX7T731_9SPHN|nr:S8 family peptidase [Parasphingorhabdus cellanae]QTD56025.1 S8 family serine peptidase [Parasphingorhabdus cellanae]
MKRPSNYRSSKLAIALIIFGTAVPSMAQTIDPIVEQPVTEQSENPAPSVHTDVRPIVPMGGSIDPFSGSIDPFSGSLDPFSGSIDPFAGNINPFEGNIDPFSGNLNPFHGEIRALWGAIDPFGGNLDPFAGNVDPFAGNVDPFYGNLDPFQGEIDPLSGTVLPSYIETNSFWHSFGATWRETNLQLNDIAVNGNTNAKRTVLENQINSLINQSKNLWGTAVEARTGQTFEASFLNPLFAKFGISNNRVWGFRSLSQAQRAQLVSEWYDGLMGYSGRDHVDHWMRTINWTPELTKIQGSGADSVIGILDSSFVNDPDLTDNVFHSGGYSAQVGGHGTGVASLLIAAHDGRGIMGIAPNASVATYNPFDHTGSASWNDITDGIVSLKNANASVINMSLGVSGWTLHPEWNNVFNNSDVKKVAKDTVFVIAAGNDGITQTQNVEFKRNSDIGLIVVGAVDPVGNISSLSNKPGSVCLSDGGKCKDGYDLKDIFIVAPGELILMADGNGGVTRRSGTSFAAPLVSGAITLLHDRWQWLTEHPEETVSIILDSAQDLGAPGVDDVYGVGLLDVEASQSPLDFNSLEFYEYRGNKKLKRKAADLQKTGVGATWNAQGVFLTMFEKIGGTHRDFAVPFSSQLIGQKTSVTGSNEYFQSYITDRFVDWSTPNLTSSKAVGGFTDVASYDSPKREGWHFAISASNPTRYLTNGRQGELPHSAIKFGDAAGQFSFNAGYGHGAIALLGQQSFGLTSDYDTATGGLNPVLGLASGGGFLDAEFAIVKNTTVAFGLTSRRLDHSENQALSEAERMQLRGAKDYQASAFNLRMTHKPFKAATVSVSFASLNEKDGLLGVQSALENDLRHGSNSKTITVGASFDLPHGINIAASATAAMTKSNGGLNQNLRTNGNVRSSAYAFSIGKQGLMRKDDRLRMSFTQPLHVENGTLEYTAVEVIDRSTGEIGSVTRDFNIADNNRRFTGELLYATPVMGGGELSFFGRAQYDASARNNVNEIIAGGVLSLPF